MKTGSLICLLVLAFAAGAQEDPDAGRLQVIGEEGVIGDLPLEHTSVEIIVSGPLQRATVRQVYGNPFTTPIEAVYTFPLPQSGAVDRMDMYIGERLVHGQIYERELAQQIYQDAIDAGQTASLLEQERPNIFTQTVGNILPGDSITIEISYVAPVEFDDGEYELVFPMVVGPRFIPGNPIMDSLMGWADPTDQVPDADRITPLVVPEGTRAGYDIDLSVVINAGVDVQQLESVNHEVRQVINRDGSAEVSLAPNDNIPNKDFVLRFTTATDRIEAGVLATNTNMGGHFMLIIQPDADVDRDDIAPKELFFVVDCSGSMSGQPMEVAKETVRQFVAGMNPDDTFQIMRFSETASSMSRTPLSNTEANIQTGIDYINAMYGSGGTMMIEGVRAAIGYPEDPERMRFVIFLTDGYIGNEAEILGELQATLGENTRLFSIGVGSSPNRYLIEGLSEEGRGHAYYVSLNEDPSDAVESIYQKINDPYLVGIDIDWGDLDVHDVYPRRIPDLYAGEPLVIVGQYDGGGSDRVTVSGTVAGSSWSTDFRVSLPERQSQNDVIATLWARKKIHELNREMYDQYGYEQYDQDIVDQITDVALDYQIMSKYTAFVAVSEEVRTDPDGNPITVEVPVNMPEGVSYEGVFGTHGESSGAIYTGSTMNRSTAPSPGVQYGFGGGAVGQTMALDTCCEEAGEYEYWNGRGSEDDLAWYGSPSVRLVSANPHLGLLASEMRSAVRLVLPAIQAEFEDALDALEVGDDVPVGSIVFTVTFRSDGTVSGVEVSSNGTGDDDLAESIGGILETVTVPAPPDGAGSVSVTISLEGVY
jgi:Ca-activated chloride channel family protein